MVEVKYGQWLKYLRSTAQLLNLPTQTTKLVKYVAPQLLNLPTQTTKLAGESL